MHIVTPQVRVRDFFVKAGLDQDYTNGTFALDVDLNNRADKLRTGDFSVEYKLLDNNNKLISSEVQPAKINRKSDLKLTFSKVIPNPEKWTAESFFTLFTKGIRIGSEHIIKRWDLCIIVKLFFLPIFFKPFDFMGTACICRREHF